MVNEAIQTSEYKEVTKAYKRGDKQYYYLNIKLREVDDLTIVIREIYDHEPTDDDKTALNTKYCDMVRGVRLNDIKNYDLSDNVNSIIIDGICTWLDKATRVGLANSLSVELAAGKVETTLYLNDTAITCSIAKAQEILQAIELYALECYRTTERHKAAVKLLNTPAELEDYDYTAGYPAVPEYHITDNAE
jgi:hypothetical protein